MGTLLPFLFLLVSIVSASDVCREDVTSTHYSVAHDLCPLPLFNNLLLPHNNCRKYYQCVDGTPQIHTCQHNLLYDVWEETCVPFTLCNERIIEECAYEEETPEPSTDHEDSNEDHVNVADSPDPNTDHEDSDEDHVNVADSPDPNTDHEDSDEDHVNVADSPDPNTDHEDSNEDDVNVVDTPDSNTDHEDSNEDHVNVVETPNPDTDHKDSNEDVNVDDDKESYFDQAIKKCAVYISLTTPLPHENCQYFYVCNQGRPVLRRCPGVQLLSLEPSVCKLPQYVDCGDRIRETNIEHVVTPVPVETPNPNTEQEDGVNVVGTPDSNTDHEDGNEDHVNDVESPNPNTEHGDGNEDHVNDVESPDPNTDHEDGNDDHENDVESPNPNTDHEDSNEDHGNEVETPDPNTDTEDSHEDVADDKESYLGQAIKKCAVYFSLATPLPHKNCQNFYICSHGRPQLRSCPGVLYLSVESGVCDWPQNVDCGDRIRETRSPLNYLNNWINKRF